MGQFPVAMLGGSIGGILAPHGLQNPKLPVKARGVMNSVRRTAVLIEVIALIQVAVVVLKGKAAVLT
jgi:hypothetical protein